MHLVVDEARQQMLAAQVDRGRAGGARACAEPLDAVAANQHVGCDDLPLVDDLRVDEQQGPHGAPMREKRSVAAMSSAKMPGSNAEWPASGTILKSASGQRRCSSQAVSIGHTTS